jgi:prolyl-tRNA synthetase
VWCKACDYAANVEAARRRTPEGSTAPAPDTAPPPEKVHTPDLPSIAGISKFLQVEPNETLKVIVFDVDGEIGLAVVPGDREINEYALAAALAPKRTRLFADADWDAHPELPKGYIGPDFDGAAVVVADPAVTAPIGWIAGANEVDHHIRNVVLGRDFDVDLWADLVTIVNGDTCPRCGQPLSVDRGIEVGHVFQIGTKYSIALDATYTDENGDMHPMVMGCYGIGVSRVVAAIVEEHHDENGIAWPAALSPYDVHLLVVPGRGEKAAEVLEQAERIYEQLGDAGVAVLYDDRDVSPGVKFADADLVGVPVQVVVGAKGLAKGIVERKDRATGTRDDVPLADIVSLLS